VKRALEDGTVAARLFGLLSLAGLLLLPMWSSAAEPVRWLLWKQTEYLCRPIRPLCTEDRRGAPRILDEFSSLAVCDRVKDRFMWNKSRRLEAEPGDVKWIDYYACVPLPLKPERIEVQGWR